MRGPSPVQYHNIVLTSRGRKEYANLPETEKNRDSFRSILHSTSLISSNEKPAMKNSSALIPAHIQFETALNTSSPKLVLAGYEKNMSQYNEASDWQKYKDDQLLSNPGGDNYYLWQEKALIQPNDQETFRERITKNVSDCFSNLKNFFKNLFSGAKTFYRDKGNRIRETTQRGVLSSVGDFFKDLGSALSLGTWRPDGEKEPDGFVERLGFFFRKIKEAVLGDLVQGVSGSALHMGEDLLLAGWNLAEVLPDATIGNFRDGKNLTTAIFDNGQVVIDYLTDILPTGEAWLRVHAIDFKGLKAPLLYNLSMPEHYTGDMRWEHVRNTPFRKTIETIGSLLSDIVVVRFLGETKGSSEEHREKN